MALTRELTLLCRLTHLTCWEQSRGCLHADGYGCNAVAMNHLKSVGIIHNVGGVGRGIGGDWKSLEWVIDDGFETPEAVLAITDAVAAIVNQYVAHSDPQISITSRTPNSWLWRSAADYLAACGVVDVEEQEPEMFLGRIVDFGFRTRR